MISGKLGGQSSINLLLRFLKVPRAPLGAICELGHPSSATKEDQDLKKAR